MYTPDDLRDSLILIVDDTPANIDLLATLLEADGYKLLFATSGEKALQVCARRRPDLILLDVMMPGMDGFETCQQLMQLLGEPPVPILFVTARDDSGDLVRGFDAGAVDYLTKPIRREEVLARVRTHLHNSFLLHLRDALYREQIEQAESMRIVLNNIAEAVFMHDQDGRLQMLNPAAERLFGVAPGALLGERLADWLTPASSDLYSEQLREWRTLHNHSVSFGPKEISIRRVTGEAHEVDLSVSGLAVARPLYIGIMHDIEAQKRETHELRRLLRVDPLTQLANRRAFDEVLHREWSRATEQGSALSLLMIDIDHFKAYNDYYGHQQGDQCLRQVALCLARNSQAQGALAARYGGEEFALVLPGMDAMQAQKVVEHLQQELQHMNLPHVASPVVPQVSLSIGIATQNVSMDDSVAALIRRADQALYAAKFGGRNQYRMAG